MPPARGIRTLLESSIRTNRPQIRPNELQKAQARGLCTCRNTSITTANQSSRSTSLQQPQQYISRPIRTVPQTRHASSTTSELKHTPLDKVHTEAGAKMVPFAGYSMPLEYPDQSHPESHRWTRANASLFDVSHMVQHKLSGPLAEEFLMTITPSSINTLKKHHSSLSCLLDENGGIIDDTVITRLGRDSFYFVTNAGCRDTDLAYIEKQMTQFLESKGVPNAKSDENIKWHVLNCHSLVALQGPKSQEVLQALVYHDTEDDTGTSPDLSTLGFGESRWLQLTTEGEMNTPSLLVSRTGYTGEDGFEISIPSENGDSTELATAIAKSIINDSSIVRWAGLAARDSLRLEAGMCLYGHDISTQTTPPMAALGWIVGKDRRSDSASPAFYGRSRILEQLASPKTMSERRVGFLVEKGPAAREGAEVVDPEKNEVIGKITSGCPSPSMDGQNIAMGLIKNGYHKSGTKVGVKVRKGVRKAEVSRMPFVPNKFYRPDSKDAEKKEVKNNTGTK
ncbi:Aminomethyltransferase, mitochondrial [Knufia fluminis]|uniref:aminomethyltransferase n=1 Tax=Knufia fluminis TaxID=191047 RepID=A0AAN8EJB5_9EURO|nr:Aminomethyltransferase, mitochondrial [Knufia fluminis]